MYLWPPCLPKLITGSISTLLELLPSALLHSASIQKSPLALLPSQAGRRESVSEYDVKSLYFCTCVLGVTAITNHLCRHHKDIWEAYVLARNAKKTAQANNKEEELIISSSCKKPSCWDLVNWSGNKLSLMAPLCYACPPWSDLEIYGKDSSENACSC